MATTTFAATLPLKMDKDGVIEVSRKVVLGVAIEEILYLAEVRDHGELDGQIIYLPLK